jgi:hypothetical protein
VGGFSYQKDVFTYLHGALHLGAMVSTQCKEGLDINIDMNKSLTSHPWIVNSLRILESYKK